MARVRRMAVALVALVLVAGACSRAETSATSDASEGGATGSGAPGADAASPAEATGAAPAGADNAQISDWTDPRPAEWREDYPLFAPLATGDGSLQRVQDAGKIVICTALGLAPWNSLDPATQGVVGIEPMFHEAYLPIIGVPEVEYVNFEFQALIPALQAERCDMISASLGIRADRAEQIRFTLPWVLTYDQFVVRSDSPHQAAADLVGGRIGTFAGSADEDVLRAWVEEQGQGSEVLTFTTPNECFLGTQNGTIDACFTDQVSVSAAIGEFTELRPLDEAFSYAAGFPDDAARSPYILLSIGPSTRLEDNDLNLALSIAIKQLIDDGTQRRILEEFDLYDENQDNFIRPDA